MSSETSRIEAYSDGVFSIAATLLVLNLKPPAASLPFWQGLAVQWPGFVGFLLSFLLIGIMWLNHHRLFSHIRRADDLLMLANLLLLLGVVWIPYPTALMAQAVASGRIREAAILFNGSFLVVALLFNLLLFTCMKRKLVDARFGAIESIAARYSIGPIAYTICLVSTWWSVPVSLAINGGMAVFFLLTPQAAKEQSGGPVHADRE